MSVATSRKGLETKQIIISAAKKLFYQSGYTKTSIKEICDLAKVKTGTFTYYFNIKEDLLKDLYNTIFMKSYAFVGSHTTRSMNSLEKNTIVAFIYFFAFLKDENMRNFHYEILKTESVGDYISQSSSRISRQFIKDFNLNFSEKEALDVEMADNGISREMVSHFIEHPEERSLLDLINVLYIFRARLYCIDSNLMKVYLYNGMEFERTFDHSHITLL